MSEQLANWRDKNLNSISCSFCAAKWYNVSLHLGHGFTNSCHLPLPHPIDLEKIKTNPSALHNTDFKKEIRKMAGLKNVYSRAEIVSGDVEIYSMPDKGTAILITIPLNNFTNEKGTH